MIVGDSISHGQEGDYTWRYRLWQWLQSNNVCVDFVGPYKGTNPPDEITPPSPPNVEPRTFGGYALDAEPFGSDHFAVWGRQAAQVKDQIATQIPTYMPDHLLIVLGFNDLGWFVSGPEGTLQSMKVLVDNARAVKPDLKFSIANVPQRSHIEGRDDLPIITDQYNELLAEAIPQWSTVGSPIKLVTFREEYSCDPKGCPAAYDGLHPNALGEYQIAKAFSMALRDDYAPGGDNLTIPANIPARPCPTPVNVQATYGFGNVVITWDKVYGAFNYDVQNRVGADGVWSDPSTISSAPRWETGGLAVGTTYEYRLRAGCGDMNKSEWSDVVSIVAHV